MAPTSASAPLPPLPTVPTSGNGSPSPQPQGMEALMAGLAPIKASVDQIVNACRAIVTSGAVPGAESPCGQIIALAVSLLPAAAQQAMNPMTGAPAGGGPPPMGGGSGGGIPPMGM